MKIIYTWYPSALPPPDDPPERVDSPRKCIHVLLASKLGGNRVDHGVSNQLSCLADNSRDHTLPSVKKNPCTSGATHSRVIPDDLVSFDLRTGPHCLVLEKQRPPVTANRSKTAMTTTLGTNRNTSAHEEHHIECHSFFVRLCSLTFPLCKFCFFVVVTHRKPIDFDLLFHTWAHYFCQLCIIFIK